MSPKTTSPEKAALLRRVPAFAALPEDRMAGITRALDIVEVEAGRVLLRQDHHGFEFYLVLSGTARVERDGEVLAHVGAGEVLGEMALLGQGTRNATVVAETDMVLATSMRPHFAALLADYESFDQQVRQSVSERAV